MYNIIVFSKDRACQLELFLRSFKRLVYDSENYFIQVLEKWSNGEFERGYGLLSDMYHKDLHVMFYSEFSDLFKDMVLAMTDADCAYTVFFVDDDIFKLPFDFYDKQKEQFDNDQRILCRSLRLGRNLNHCYPMRMKMKQPLFYENNVYVWEGQQLDYGYPFSLDGHIFRTADILPHLRELEYSNPNTLEGAMQKIKTNKNRMICYYNPVIVNNAINRVQTVNNNICGEISAEYLNERFLHGKIIDLDPFVGKDYSSCHIDQKINFIDIN